MDFHVLLWKFDESSTAIRQFFVRKKRLASKSARKPEDRTLTVLNILPYCTEAALENLFTSFGKIDEVFFQNDLTSEDPPKTESDIFRWVDQPPLQVDKIAIVVFHSSKGLEKFLKFVSAKHDPQILSTEASRVKTGIAAWMDQKKRPLPSLVDLKREIDEYMEAYDTRQEAEQQKVKQNLGEPDEDGWVTVTRVGKKRGTRQEKVTSEAAESAVKKKNSEKELQDFYKFQVREGKVKRKFGAYLFLAVLLVQF
ncbi:hypothetical protein RvY_13146-2 [Ramazzottius varieornatus]|uniref:Ribosomal RNA-processing protein 7 C-terminal domain-containing protein n=1 Tax=Ramazzottius varieornatus TaxID=947166 RepID=A0A1D1VLX3_RAMVA|nr:hypothetical protein RvY_13146-2 [Ramazzottius varieornatus]